MKSERVVSNPENHGWEEVNGKWIWASGRNTGHITDGDTEGQIATWHDPANAWTPESAVIVDGGNVGIGIDSPTRKLYVQDSYGTVAQFMSTGTAGGGIALSDANSASENAQRIRAEGDNLTFATDRTTRLTIDATGDAMFSGEVRSNNAGGAVRINATDQGATSPYIRFWGNQGGSWYNVGRSTADGKFHINVGSNFDSPSNDVLTIHPGGNATFSGRVEVDDFLYADALHVERALDGGGAIYFGPGISKYLFWNPGLGQWNFVGGNVYAPNITTKSGPVITTGDLIETLATLRASTLDETVDVRQALASACDKLIEKFESMQEVATQEIEE